MSQEKVVETFDRWAEGGEDARMEESHGDVVRQVVDAMGIVPGERILDLGCGNGWATRHIAKTNAGVQAIGVDSSPKMIARADELHSFTIRARYDWGSFEDLEFKDDEFDRIFSMEALYYATDLDKALAEACRVLKSGGNAHILIDYYEESPVTASWEASVGLDLHRKNEADWRAAFEQAGFSDVATTRVIDSREPASDAHADKHALHAAGTLHIHARKA